MNIRQLTYNDLFEYREAAILHNKLVGWKETDITEEDLKYYLTTISRSLYKESDIRKSWYPYNARGRIYFFYKELLFSDCKITKAYSIIEKLAREYK
jgi:hypothetical protein